jgi:hypothetical protein
MYLVVAEAGVAPKRYGAETGDPRNQFQPHSHIWWLLLKIMRRGADPAKMTEVWQGQCPLVPCVTCPS